MDVNFVTINSSLSLPLAELRFNTSRSSGPGGQNVNKLETRVELLFDIGHSQSLTGEQKAILRENLRSKIDGEGCIHVVAQESRSQWQNKQHAIQKFVRLLQNALKPRKKRVKTQPTKRAKESRIQKKKKIGAKKKLRKLDVLHE